MTPYDREVLVDVLVHHWMTNTSGCGGCDGLKLGQSYPEHIANVYEARIARKPRSTPGNP